MLAAAAEAIEFICPRCRGELECEESAYRCAPCAATYPIVLGIPDFRVEPDPWISLEDDRAKARRLIERSEGLDLARSVDAYWSMTPGTPVEHARRFTGYVLAGEQRSAEWLDTLRPAVALAPGPWLEIGCASGDMLAACTSRGIQAVGVDVAMRWLVLARKRSALARGTHTLVCANGEFLPFRNMSFARVISVGTLEHCRRADAVLAESARVVRTGGDASFRTTNRYSLLPEPHVNLWGVGFLPRRWADRYVRLRGGQGYANHRPLSASELGSRMRHAGFSRTTVGPAQLLSSDRARLGSVGRALAPLYEGARTVPVIPAIMRWIAPLLEAHGRVA